MMIKMFLRVSVLLASSMLFGCSAGAPIQQYGLMSTQALWAQHLAERDMLELLKLEAELGSRGAVTSSSGRYLGDRTGSHVGKRTYTRSPQTQPGADTKNCSDFSSSASAQKFFLAAGGPSRDPHNLDRDGDGFACEWGAQIQKNVSTYRYKPARHTYSYSRCYVGPRGGRYTITSSGRKNYGGC